jgi:hypothetical protein
VAVNVIRVAVAKIKVEINVRVTLIFTFDLQRVNRLFRSRPTVGFTCRRDTQDSTACQPPNLRKSPPHTHAEGGQVQTVLGG